MAPLPIGWVRIPHMSAPRTPVDDERPRSAAGELADVAQVAATLRLAPIDLAAGPGRTRTAA